MGKAKVVTIEGLQQNAKLSAVQEAFLEEGAFQCGYGISGMILGATSLLQDHPHPHGSTDCRGDGGTPMQVRNISSHRGCSQESVSLAGVGASR